MEIPKSWDWKPTNGMLEATEQAQAALFRGVYQEPTSENIQVYINWVKPNLSDLEYVIEIALTQDPSDEKLLTLKKNLNKSS